MRVFWMLDVKEIFYRNLFYAYSVDIQHFYGQTETQNFDKKDAINIFVYDRLVELKLQ